MKKKSVKPEKIMDIKCPRCGRTTHHYLNEETGEYKCVICQSVNKTIKVKPKKEVIFAMDPELDAALNPNQPKLIEELLANPNVDKTDGEVLDDQGNPV